MICPLSTGLGYKTIFKSDSSSETEVTDWLPVLKVTLLLTAQKLPKLKGVTV
ncbi:MAG: hypothetical protein IPL63_14670 [Saprospiraceae bacterium]|nr:hypothetical protein [Saprospiraceae bacterium]MBK8548507.1 hypothetical protein [Saprospiraceae bacterium]MBK8548551.1 hypothetical protein [Saprospiraceae bacterium]